MQNYTVTMSGRVSSVRWVITSEEGGGIIVHDTGRRPSASVSVAMRDSTSTRSVRAQHGRRPEAINADYRQDDEAGVARGDVGVRRRTCHNAH